MTQFFKPEPLSWGRGPRRLEVFLEPTCPFSGRAFSKFDALLDAAGADRLTIQIRLQSQPWHLFSPAVTRAILAASTTAAGKEAAKAVMAAVFANRDDYDLFNHASGPNLDLSLRDILSRIERHSGVTLAEAFEQADLQTEMKWHAKYARQNGIHASPTFMVDGLVAPEFSSGDTVAQWLEKLKLTPVAS
jgi:hypothetical protein